MTEAKIRKLVRDEIERTILDMLSSLKIEISNITMAGGGGSQKPRKRKPTRKLKDETSGTIWAGIGRKPKGFQLKRAVPVNGRAA